MATKTAPKTAPKQTWTVVQEFARTGTDEKYWTVARNDQTGKLRCSCPAYIFGVKSRGIAPQTTCKHIEHHEAHPEHALQPFDVLPSARAAAVDQFAARLEAVIIEQGKKVARSAGFSGSNIRTIGDAFDEIWGVRQNFLSLAQAIMDLGFESPKTVTAASTASAPVLGKRRIILPGD